MKIFILVFFCLISVNVYSQSTSIDWLLPPQGFGIPNLNSSGSSSIINNVANIGSINPASISSFNNFSVGISYQINPEIKKGWLNDSPIERNKQLIPQSFGSSYKLGNISLGLCFSQQYNTKTDFNWFGYESNITEFEGNVFSYSAIAAYSFNELFKKNSRLDVGLNISFNQADFSQKNQSSLIELSDDAVNYHFGIMYSVKNADELETRVGFSYQTNTKFEADYNSQSGMTVVIRKIDSPYSTDDINAGNIISGNNPDKINLDLTVDISSNVKVLASGKGIFWEKDKNTLDDQFEFSLGSIYKINQMFSPALSIYYTSRNYELGFYDLNEKFDALFLIAGLNLNLGMLNSDLVIADSHIISGDYRKQTIIKLAVGFTF